MSRKAHTLTPKKPFIAPVTYRPLPAVISIVAMTTKETYAMPNDEQYEMPTEQAVAKKRKPRSLLFVRFMFVFSPASDTSHRLVTRQRIRH